MVIGTNINTPVKLEIGISSNKKTMPNSTPKQITVTTITKAW